MPNLTTSCLPGLISWGREASTHHWRIRSNRSPGTEEFRVRGVAETGDGGQKGAGLTFELFFSCVGGVYACVRVCVGVPARAEARG